MSHVHPPKIRRRNRRVLLACAIVIVCVGLTPLVVRLLTPDIPRVNAEARAQYPPPASKSEIVTVYGESNDPLVGLIANRLNRLPDAAKRVFPDDLKPFEIVLFQDKNKYDKAWIEVFPGSRIKPSIGRAGFVWDLARGLNDATAPQASRQEQTGLIWHRVGESILEQQLLERLRLVPASYRSLIAEMFVVAIDPAHGRLAESQYDELRKKQAALSEHDWLKGFSPAPWAMQRTVTTLLAQMLVTGRRSSELVTIIDRGEDLETAFRAAAVGSLPAQSTQGTPASAVAGTSIGAALGRIEQASLKRRSTASGPDH